MKPPLIAGNWKMYRTVSEARSFVQEFLTVYKPDPSVDIVMAPPFTALQSVHDALRSTQITLAAQNVYWKDEGAFTGEISPPMLKDLGCQYVILGHSERRQHFGEHNELINQKIHSVLTHDLLPIFCVGERLEERKSGRTMALIEKQILEGLKDVNKKQIERITIAYEPVWAIGTGLAATVEQATEVHTHISMILEKQWGVARDTIRILYGGSVSPDNADELFQSPQINGALVGRACLIPDSFANIIDSAQRASH